MQATELVTPKKSEGISTSANSAGAGTSSKVNTALLDAEAMGGVVKNIEKLLSVN